MELVVTFAGILELDTRKAHEVRAQKNGCKIAEDVTRSTTFLVCGKDSGRAVEKAKNIGVRVISEEKWINTLRKMETSGNGKKRTRSDNKNQKKLIYLESRQYRRFWQIRRVYKTTYIRTGLIGTKGMETSKEHETKTLAKDSVTSLTAAKKKAGYREANRPQSLDYEDSSDSSDDSFDSWNDKNKHKQKKRRTGYEESESDATIYGDTDTGTSDVSNEQYLNLFKNQRESCQTDEDEDGPNKDSSAAKSIQLPSSVTNLMSVMKGSSVDVLLAYPWKSDEVDPTGWWISEKLDGVRAFWNAKRGKFFSRNGIEYVAPSW